MKKLMTIIKKNYLILLKSRWQALVFILFPMLIILLAGLAFDNIESYSIKIGVYSPSYNQLTNSFITKLNSDPFVTIKEASEADCVDDVKIGLSHTCVIFPAGLSLNSTETEISIYIDYSRLNLAWIIRDRLFSSLEERSKEITKELAEDILTKMYWTKGEIGKDRLILSFLQLSEQEFANQTEFALSILQQLNGSVLSTRDIEVLESKINSVKAASDQSLAEARNALSLAVTLAHAGDFNSDTEDKYISMTRKLDLSIAGQENYVNKLFDANYDGSINTTFDKLKIRIENVGTTGTQATSLTQKIYETISSMQEVIASKERLGTRLDSSLEGIQRRLSTADIARQENVLSPVVAEIKPLASFNSNLDFVFPTLMAISLMLAAFFMATIQTVVERNSPAFFRNAISPTYRIIFFLASYITNLSLVAVQVGLMLLITFFFSPSMIGSNLASILAICFLSATFFIFLGMLAGYIFKSEPVSILGTTFISSIFMFMSNLLIPIENMPDWMLGIVEWNPFILTTSLLRKAILFNQPLALMQQEISMLMFLIEIAIISYLAVYYYRSRQLVKKELHY